MPIIKNSDKYIDQIHAELQDHYHITIPKRIVKTVINQYELSINNALKQGKQVELTNTLTLYPCTPLIKSVKHKYYNAKKSTPKRVRKLKEIARIPRKTH